MNSPEWKTWGSLTDEEKGQLLLAHHRGQRIFVQSVKGYWIRMRDPDWTDSQVYRVAPKFRVGASYRLSKPMENQGGLNACRWVEGHQGVFWNFRSESLFIIAEEHLLTDYIKEVPC